ncbi:MAG: aminotransferase class IV [Flavipsychrobacter sp.]|nr:aminotransferase class IV [Flavipsychrobacter sp.]
MSFININGKITPVDKAVIAPDNRAFRYGYGLFETMLYQNGALQLKDLHFKRLFSGLQQLDIVLPALYTQSWIEENIAKTVQRNNLEECCRVRLQVYAGDGGLYEKNTHPGIVIECFPIDEGTLQLNENGLAVGFAAGIQKSADSLANLKSCNALVYAIAAQQAMTSKWNDALISNTNNHIIESTIANVFWIKGGAIYTPPLKDGCVAGVMREHIMSTLAYHKIDIQQQNLDIKTLLQADEVFLTNAIRKIRWVGILGDKIFTNSYTRHLWQLLFA